jgi:hypothetical protein
MLIHTLWKQWEGEAVELVGALDDSTFVENDQAWADCIASACKRYGCDKSELRYLIYEVDGEAIYKAFETPVLQARIVEP